MSAKPVVSALKSYIEPYRVDGSKAFHLKAHDTNGSGGLHKETGKKIIEANRRRLQELQEKLYAQDRWSLLLIFRAWTPPARTAPSRACSTASIRRAARCIRSRRRRRTSSIMISCGVTPSRCHSAAASASSIALTTRNVSWCACIRRFSAKQKIPAELVTKDIWRERFEDITAFEKYLARNGTVVLKFFLNVSKEEQRERFLDRLEQPAKNWKFSSADIAERALWDKYQEAYEDLIKHTSCEEAPWHVVPADRKWFSAW